MFSQHEYIPYLIEFNQLAMAHAEGSDAMFNRVMLKDNIGIAALLEVKDSTALPSQHVLVANAHIHWDPEFADVKLIQTLMLTNELNNIVMKAQTERGIGFKTPIPGMPGVPVMISTPCQTPVWWSTCVQVGLPPATETCRATATTASSRDSLPQFEEGSEPRRGNQSWSTSSTCAGPTVDRWSTPTSPLISRESSTTYSTVLIS